MKLSTNTLVCAHLLVAAALFSLHHSVAVVMNGGSYTPFVASLQVSSLTYDETFFYAPQARKFMSLGRLSPESDNYELRHLHGAMPFLSAVILGAMGHGFGSLEAAFIAADALFPPALLALLFALSENIVKGFSTRFLIAWATLLAGFAPRSFLGLGLDGPRGLLEITRTPNPEISVLIFLMAIFCLARALRPGAGWRPLTIAVIASAMNVYTYYFYTVAWAITLTLLLGMVISAGNRRLAVRTAVISVSAALLAIPFLAAILIGRAEGGQSNLLAQFGDTTHEPNLVALILAVFGLLLLLLRGRMLFGLDRVQLRLGLLCLAIVAGLLGMNVQIVSGQRFQQFHFVYRLIEPVGLFLAGCVVAAAIERSSSGGQFLKRAAVPALVVLVVFAAARQAVAGAAVASSQRSDAPEIELLTWARAHLPADSVIGTCDPQLVLLIPAIAPAFTYIPSHLRSLTSTGEIVARSVELSSLLNCPLDEFAVNAAPTFHTGNFPLTGRLNYVVLNSGQQDLPENLKQQFPDAHLVYRNRKYRLLATAR